MALSHNNNILNAYYVSESEPISCHLICIHSNCPSHQAVSSYSFPPKTAVPGPWPIGLEKETKLSQSGASYRNVKLGWNPHFMALLWKKASRVSIDRWMVKEDAVYICAMEYFSATKWNEIMPFVATQMDLEIIILSEEGQTKRSIIWYQLCVESKKWYKWTYLQKRNRLTDIENKLMDTKGGREEGINKDLTDTHY